MANLRVRRLVTQWYGKARREADEFSEFVFLYFCFNALISNLSGKYNDRQALDWTYDNANPIRDAYEFFLQHKSIDDCVARLRRLPPIPTHRPPPAPEFLVVPDTGTMREVLNYVYQVRCNLFHGRKDPQDQWDVAYVRACNAILKPLIRRVISQLDERGTREHRPEPTAAYSRKGPIAAATRPGVMRTKVKDK